jgi:hypothetical protein
MTIENSRRIALAGLGSLVVSVAAFAAGRSRAANNETTVAPGARKLSELMVRLRRAPRRATIPISGMMKRSRLSSPTTPIASRYGTIPTSQARVKRR